MSLPSPQFICQYRVLRMPNIWQQLLGRLKGKPAAPPRPPQTLTLTLTLADFPDGQGTPVIVGGRRLAIFHLGEQVFAIDNVCSHNFSPLAGGLVSRYSCHLSNASGSFQLRNGRGPAWPSP